MAARFEELAYVETPIGPVSLRRRRDPLLDAEVHEVLLGDEYLMSSLFTVAEEELARLGLAAVPASRGDRLAVVVGGLGLGYTARAALADARVASLVVVDYLQPVIDWHRAGLVPLGREVAGDPRTTLLHGDFFARVRDGSGFTGGAPVDAILLDVDHSPRHVLAPEHADLYTGDGLRRLAALLAPGGVFALWSDDPPDEDFIAVCRSVWASVEAHVVTFPNPFTRGESANTVYVAR